MILAPSDVPEWATVPPGSLLEAQIEFAEAEIRAHRAITDAMDGRSLNGEAEAVAFSLVSLKHHHIMKEALDRLVSHPEVES